MLLVDDHQPEVAEHDVFLDERVGPHQQRLTPVGHRLEDLAARASGGAPDQQARGHVVLREHGGEGGLVLAGENLRRGHHGGLEAGAVRHQRCHRSDHCLAAADVALEEAVHRAAARHVGEHLVGGDALALGEPEWQR